LIERSVAAPEVMQEYAMELSVPMTRFKVNERVRFTEQAARGMMNLGNQHNAVIPWDARVGTMSTRPSSTLADFGD
jgi:hypothetical protein